MYELLWGGKALLELTSTYIDHPGIVVDGVVPVLSGNFMLCGVRETHFQETSLHFSTRKF